MLHIILTFRDLQIRLQWLVVAKGWQKCAPKSTHACLPFCRFFGSFARVWVHTRHSNVAWRKDSLALSSPPLLLNERGGTSLQFPDIRAALSVALYKEGLVAEAETNWGRMEVRGHLPPTTFGFSLTFLHSSPYVKPGHPLQRLVRLEGGKCNEADAR